MREAIFEALISVRKLYKRVKIKYVPEISVLVDADSSAKRHVFVIHTSAVVIPDPPVPANCL